MRVFGCLAAFVVLFGHVLAVAAQDRVPDRPVSVGAIRWDNWTNDSPHAKVILEPGSKERVPFFAVRRHDGSTELRGGTPPVVSAENKYAFSAGLDYWIFGFYPDVPSRRTMKAETTRLSLALESYLSLPSRDGMRFSLSINQSYPASDLSALSQIVGSLASHADYVRLDDGSVPVFVLDSTQWEKQHGGIDGASQALQLFKTSVEQHARLKVRLVLLGFSDLRPVDNYVGDGKPFDAFSTYANAPKYGSGVNAFSECAQVATSYWSAAEAKHKPFFPTVTLGWDYRPTLSFPDQLYGRPKNPGWCVPARDEEIVRVVRAAMAVGERSSQGLPFRSVVLYAWNEFSEGGWIAPTLQEGTRRLNVLSEALGRARRFGSEVRLTFPADLSSASCLPASASGAAGQISPSCLDGQNAWPCPVGTLAGIGTDRLSNPVANPSEGSISRTCIGR